MEYDIRVLNEELAASSADRVFAWLEGRRGTTDDGLPRWKVRVDSDSLDAGLLMRGDRLIDLGVARYGIDRDSVVALWNRNDPVLQLAVLANQCVNTSWALRNLPEILGENGPASASWLLKAGSEEIGALFSNPTIDREYLANVLRRKGRYEELTWEVSLGVVGVCAGNPLFARPNDDVYSLEAAMWHRAPIAAAWELLEAAPVHAWWASALTRLLENSTDMPISVESVLKRWQGPLSKDEEQSVSLTAGRKSSLVGAQNIRLLAYKQAREIPTTTLLASDDPAARCCAYVSRDLAEPEIKAGIAKDGLLCYWHVLRNQKIWRDSLLRGVVLSLAGSVPDESNNLFALR